MVLYTKPNKYVWDAFILSPLSLNMKIGNVGIDLTDVSAANKNTAGQLPASEQHFKLNKVFTGYIDPNNVYLHNSI